MHHDYEHDRSGNEREEVAAVEIGEDARLLEAEAGVEAWHRRLLRWAVNAAAAGIIISVAVHLILLLISAFISLDRPGRPEGSSLAEIELAVMSESELTQLRRESLEEQQIPLDSLELEDVQNPIEFTEAVSDPGGEPLGTGDVSPIGGAAESVGEGFEAASGAGGAGASFFGVEARGQRFAYIVDTSGSMEGPKIETLRTQLAESIDGLLTNSSFVILLFATETRVIGGRAKWMSSSDRTRRLAKREIRAITARGQTNPLPAFELAFSMRPRPDAIYFMTDGVFQDNVAWKVAELNAQSNRLTPIHCISFVSKEAERLLRGMARESGGTYTHIADPNL